MRRYNESRHLYTPEGIFDSEDANGELIEGTWRKNQAAEKSSLYDLKKTPRKSSSHAQAIRNEMAEYFVTNGRVDWQDQKA